MNHIELSKRALKDLRRIDHANRQRLLDLLEQDLAAEPQPPNLDVKPLVGRAPWLRLRRGAYRILYRPLTETELLTLRAEEDAGASDRDRSQRPSSQRSCRDLAACSAASGGALGRPRAATGSCSSSSGL